MAGNKEGGIKARAKILENNPNFYKEIGAIGGKKTADSGKLYLVGFASDPERARTAGAKGGSRSKRGGKRHDG